MGLKEYVERQMKEKGLNAKQIERKSGKKVTDTHIAYIKAGKSKNPSIRIILGLAEGLDVDPVEVFKIAAGIREPEEKWTVDSLIRANQKMAKLKPAEIRQIKKLLKIE